ncbi:WD40 repeat-like protein [Polyplosphaeria fusca]|uniref:Pre-rRNA-processing protein IPI3 n=1 Tax=Polyplosphaeria fusca TaxID=682080 RepID=A0A9P4RD12_9PLEO|nr:WD40 repeat-like protein [Polyplosphaeria fusca]
MLTEHFVASISAQTKSSTAVAKDAGIFFHEYQPIAAQRHVFKKSATAPNCLAVNESHIFAVQDGKAVVHVYNREMGNQEAIVPFGERIQSIALSGETIVLLGTESGKILAWEVTSGRLVSTSTSHLQPVTVIAVDPTGNFFLSGSDDSIIHVWSLPSILSFAPDVPRSPIHTLSTHREPIASIVCGHSSTSANIAISLSRDKSAIVWDYHNGRSLRTYLLPDTPTAVALDPADRAFYVAYQDGSLQTIPFFDALQQSATVDLLRDGSSSHQPIQPPPKTRFSAESQKLDAGLSLGLSWDGTTLVSAHRSGKIVTWDIAKSNYMSTLATLPGPVTNLLLLCPTGFPVSQTAKFKVHAVTKPKQESALSRSESGLVHANYSLNMQFTGNLDVPTASAVEKSKLANTPFDEALSHSTFPTAMLEESLEELEGWGTHANGVLEPAADFLALDSMNANDNVVPANISKEEVDELREQLGALKRIQKFTFSQLRELRKENKWFKDREKEREAQKTAAVKAKWALANGTSKNEAESGHVEMSEAESDGDASSDESEASAHSGDDSTSKANSADSGESDA